MVSMLKINACMQLEKMSKYSDSTAGRPTWKNGMLASAPGRNLNTAADSADSAAYTSAVTTVPEATFPK